MSGHSKWSQIKRKKAVTDAKKGKLFSRFAKNIELAAQKGADPGINYALRETIDVARAANMPGASIERAIKKGSGAKGSAVLKEVWYGGFSPGGAAILIKTLTDNKNRTVSELKHLLTKNSGQFVDTGSVRWMFTNKTSKSGIQIIPKTIIPLSPSDQEKLTNLLDIIEDHEDVQEVFTNTQ